MCVVQRVSREGFARGDMLRSSGEKDCYDVPQTRAQSVKFAVLFAKGEIPEGFPVYLSLSFDIDQVVQLCGVECCRGRLLRCMLLQRLRVGSPQEQ